MGAEGHSGRTLVFSLLDSRDTLYSLHSYPSLYPAESYPELPVSLPVVPHPTVTSQVSNCKLYPAAQARVLCLVFYTTLGKVGEVGKEDKVGRKGR